MQIGIKNEERFVVTEHMTAASLGSGTSSVLSTPYMIALMEGVALRSVKNDLEEGTTTVGIEVHVKHLASTPVGAEIVVISELIEMDRKKLTFKIEARNKEGVIGEGTHKRFIVSSSKFIDKANSK